MGYQYLNDVSLALIGFSLKLCFNWLKKSIKNNNNSNNRIATQKQATWVSKQQKNFTLSWLSYDGVLLCHHKTVWRRFINISVYTKYFSFCCCCCCYCCLQADIWTPILFFKVLTERDADDQKNTKKWEMIPIFRFYYWNQMISRAVIDSDFKIYTTFVKWH